MSLWFLHIFWEGERRIVFECSVCLPPGCPFSPSWFCTALRIWTLPIVISLKMWFLWLHSCWPWNAWLSWFCSLALPEAFCLLASFNESLPAVCEVAVCMPMPFFLWLFLQFSLVPTWGFSYNSFTSYTKSGGFPAVMDSLFLLLFSWHSRGCVCCALTMSEPINRPPL